MTRRLAVALLAVFAASTAAESLRNQEPAPDRLVIDAVVLDGNGVPLSDLRRDEVEVWIAGYRVPIDTFIAITPDTDERSGRLIVVLLDDITMPLTLAERAREAARRFVNRMSPADRLSIVTLSGAPMGDGAGPAQLLKNIDSYTVQASGVTPFDVLGARVLTTLTGVARRLEAIPNRRKAIIAIGTAWLFDTPLPPPQLGRSLRDEWVGTMRALASANAVMYLIEPSGVGMAPTYSGSGFARETGGHAFVNTNDLTGAADRILREANSYYLIVVRDPPIQRKADLRPLDVRVLRRGTTVRARKAVLGAR
jgi:VWFA-related protein